LDVKKRFTEEQIIGFLREAEAGLAVAELCRRHGFSEASYYLWRSKFGGIDLTPNPHTNLKNTPDQF
jgi:putative transposase